MKDSFELNYIHNNFNYWSTQSMILSVNSLIFTFTFQWWQHAINWLIRDSFTEDLIQLEWIQYKIDNEQKIRWLIVAEIKWIGIMRCLFIVIVLYKCI